MSRSNRLDRYVKVQGEVLREASGARSTALRHLSDFNDPISTSVGSRGGATTYVNPQRHDRGCCGGHDSSQGNGGQRRYSDGAFSPTSTSRRVAAANQTVGVSDRGESSAFGQFISGLRVLMDRMDVSVRHTSKTKLSISPEFKLGDVIDMLRGTHVEADLLALGIRIDRASNAVVSDRVDIDPASIAAGMSLAVDAILGDHGPGDSLPFRIPQGSKRLADDPSCELTGTTRRGYWKCRNVNCLGAVYPDPYGRGTTQLGVGCLPELTAGSHRCVCDTMDRPGEPLPLPDRVREEPPRREEPEPEEEPRERERPQRGPARRGRRLSEIEVAGMVVGFLLVLCVLALLIVPAIGTAAGVAAAAIARVGVAFGGFLATHFWRTAPRFL